MDEHTIKCDIEMGRNREKLKHIVPTNPKQKQGTSPVEPETKIRNIPNGVANSITERKFLWLGGTTIDSMTP